MGGGVQYLIDKIANFVPQIESYEGWTIAKTGNLCIMKKTLVFSADNPLNVDQPFGNVFRSDSLWESLSFPPTSVVKFHNNSYFLGATTPTYGGYWYYFGGGAFRIISPIATSYHGAIEVYAIGILV